MWRFQKYNVFTSSDSILNQRGVISAALVFIFVLLTCSYLGFIGLRLYWTKNIYTQYRLDQCVQKTSKNILNDIQNIENSHARMRAQRVVIQGAMAAQSLPVVEAASAILKAEGVYRQTVLAKWKIRQTSWIIKRGCDKKSDFFFPLTPHPWLEEPPDVIGERPWELNPLYKNTLFVKLWNPPRYSAAKIYQPLISKKGVQSVLSLKNWNAEWTTWTSIY